MPAITRPRINFDTNVCNVLHDPQKRPKLVTPADAEKVRGAIIDRTIGGTISEASLFLECLSIPDKITYKITYLTVVLTREPRPQPDARMVTLYKDLADLGMTLLHAPLIAAETFIDGFKWADDVVFSREDRLKRFAEFIRPYPRHEPLQAFGKGLANQPSTLVRGVSNRSSSGFSAALQQRWAVAIKQEWENNPEGRKALENKLRPYFSEWCDVLILGSHYAYSNDVFCTTDDANKAGSQSIMHPSKRAELQARGIAILTPSELIQRYSL